MMLDHDTAIAAHHEAGDTRVIRNEEQVLNIIQSVYENPFISESDHLINIVTREHAQPDVQTDLTHVKEIRHNAVIHTIVGQEKKVVKLNTFHTQHKQPNKLRNQQPAKQCNEMAALLRMTQLISWGEDVKVVNTIGNYEFSTVPPSLLNEDGTMRVKGTKASLVKVLLKETNVKPIPNLPEAVMDSCDCGCYAFYQEVVFHQR